MGSQAWERPPTHFHPQNPTRPSHPKRMANPDKGAVSLMRNAELVSAVTSAVHPSQKRRAINKIRVFMGCRWMARSAGEVPGPQNRFVENASAFVP